MKAIVFEDNNGVKNFIVYESEERLFEVFSQVCVGSGTKFCTTEEQFETLKSESDYALLSEIIYKKFLGIGLYDLNGNFHEKLIQTEGIYYIEDYIEQTKIATTTKIKLEYIFLN